MKVNMIKKIIIKVNKSINLMKYLIMEIKIYYEINIYITIYI